MCAYTNLHYKRGDVVAMLFYCIPRTLSIFFFTQLSIRTPTHLPSYKYFHPHCVHLITPFHIST